MIMFCTGMCLFTIICPLINSLFWFFSLNLEQRHREQAEHESEVHRLQRQISHIRPSYPTREFEQEYAKTQDLKKIIRKFSTNEK